MSSSEFGLWVAFMAGEEIGSDHDRNRWALIVSALHNGPLIRKDKKLWRASEFAPPAWVEPEPPKQLSKAETVAQLQAMAGLMGKAARKR